MKCEVKKMKISFHQIMPKLFYTHRKLLINRTMEFNISKGQPKILDYLYYHDGCIQKDFSTEFQIEAATISNLLVAMEKKGLLYRKRNEHSARTVNVYITDKGKVIQKQMEKIYDSIDDMVFDGFSPMERERFCADLMRIYENMKQIL